MQIVHPKAGRLISFPGREKQEVFSAGSMDGFTPSRKGNNDPLLHGDPGNK